MPLEIVPSSVETSQSSADAALSAAVVPASSDASPFVQRVMAAADALLAETGQEPSVSAVRKRASVKMKVANEAMQEWRAARRDSPPVAVEANPEVPDDVQRAFMLAWKTAVDTAQRDLAVLKSDYEQKVKQMQDEHDEKERKLQADLGEAAAAVDEAEAKYEQSQAEIKALQDRNSDLSNQLSASNARAETAEKAVQDLRGAVESLPRKLQGLLSGVKPAPEGKPAPDPGEMDDDISF